MTIDIGNLPLTGCSGYNYRLSRKLLRTIDCSSLREEQSVIAQAASVQKQDPILNLIRAPARRVDAHRFGQEVLHVPDFPDCPEGARQ
jgi:hypothetical protein